MPKLFRREHRHQFATVWYINSDPSFAAFRKSLPSPSKNAVQALAPNGVLRAAINLSNFLLVTGNNNEGNPTGVSPDMAAALATALGVELELITFPSPGQLADAAGDNRWDIGNIGADPARSEHIRFSPPYSEIEGTYLVQAESSIESIDQVDRPDIKIVTKARAAYSLWLDRHVTEAEVIHTDSADASLQAFVDQKLDVLAGLRPRLIEDAKQVPGSRILDGWFMTVQQAIGTPKGRDRGGIEFLTVFAEKAISSGFVADRIDAHGVTGRLLPANP